jgi:hypothetical protein
VRERRPFVVAVVVLAASLVAAGLGAARALSDTTPTTTTTTTTAASTPTPDPAPAPSPDPAPVVHAKPKAHVAAPVKTTPRPAAPPPAPVVVTPAPAQAPAVRTPVAPARKTHVHRRVATPHRPKHVAAKKPHVVRAPAPTAPATVPASGGEQAAGQVTAAARVQSFSARWERTLSWLLFVGSLIVLACALLPVFVPGAALVVEGRLQLSLLGAALAAGGVSLWIVSAR